MSAKDVLPLIASGSGMMFVAIAAVLLWWRIAHVPLRWYWAGAGLWTVAVVLKVICALLSNAFVLHMLKGLPHSMYVTLGGLFVGVESSLFEMGLTLLAVLLWRQLGRDASRATTIGIGAGAFEAFLLGIGPIATAVFLTLSKSPEAQKALVQLEKVAVTTPLYWLAGPVERIIAVLCHASTRALILLGVSKRRYALVLWGFIFFTLLDGLAGGVHVAGLVGKISMWWIELALVPFAVVSVLVLAWSFRRWPGSSLEGEALSGDDDIWTKGPRDHAGASGSIS
jgi:hypothetical protein